ncbi:uncharacterized protein LOC131146670 isoform X2 [Malania oleifera]|uniref:uncharacterized protein LOC131146670 isoform X2 n=1 Tax=Malania oleifera TaxID=397392 RepID=UPI0025AEB0D9|nr:uncharacterized protein LOC131146670 isoform X2 [Malania oleifera]
MGESKRAIEVRSLCGASTTISIAPEKSIRELKLLLKESFPPAFKSSNFHLFLKGAKLGLHSKISGHSIEPGEFMVLIPFTKKDHHQTHDSGQFGSDLKLPDQSQASNFPDSAWSDMMLDLSSLQSISNNENQRELVSDTTNIGVRNDDLICTLKPKRKRGFDGDKPEGYPDDILSILHSVSDNFLDAQNCEKFVKVLDSVNCLSDPYSRSCMVRRAILPVSDEVLHIDNSSSCMCPSWLNTIVKAFSFLNMFAASSQMHGEGITWVCLKEALNELRKCGLKVGITDLENLSVICPKIVRFTDNEMEAKKLGNALLIINWSTEGKDQVQNNSRAAQRQVSNSKIMSAMKKRESSFKSDLWGTIKLLMCKNGNDMAAFFPLEDLLTYAKGRGAITGRNEAKSGRRSCSAASNSHSDRKRCCVEHLRNGIGAGGQMVHIEEIRAKMAIYTEIPDVLSETTKSALKHIGINRLYSHQADSIQASLSGKNVAVATMTSSGKSLCYNLPVLEVLSQDLLSCALYLFPTKALAQDQQRALLFMTEGFDSSLKIGVYDGDTSPEDRVWLRDNARLLITNPDMLHMSILPLHEQFRRILSNLRFVVIDEAHVYKGAFGCHTALILRRLRRLCSHVYSSDPSFIFCTATSANPREHVMELANLSTLELIKNDGSPSASKLFVLWNPSLCLKTVSRRTQTGLDASKIVARRSSPIVEVSCLFAEMIQHGLRCIAFCKTRKLCELVLGYTREILQETAPFLVDSVCAYRAGYIAQDRRRIENEFFSGKLCGIAATNALELGIDVGHIDATLHLGFPGSIASLWQQAGRSGRRERPSLAVYVAFDGPLDQYYMKFPQKLFRSPVECCHIDAQNQQVLEQHLVCAALEHPLSLLYDEKYFGSGLNSAIMSLKNRSFLMSDRSCDSSARIWNYIGHEKMPSHAVSIRAIEAERYKVIDKQRNELLEEIEESRAFFQVYEGAVYMHQGKTYLVMDLNVSSKIALCQAADLKYYTKTRDYTDIHVIGGEIAYPARISKVGFCQTTAQAHPCKVTTTWFGFRRIWRGSNQVFDTVELSLPTYSYESQAVWIRVPQSIKTAVEIKNFSFRSGLHAASHALLNVVPLYIICNTSDLASECANPHDTRYIPERILLYDQHPGGTGISAQVQPRFTELLGAALELLTSCCCTGDTGCPNCVQSLACHEYNEVLHKDAAIMIIKGVLDAEKLYFGGH